MLFAERDHDRVGSAVLIRLAPVYAAYRVGHVYDLLQAAACAFVFVQALVCHDQRTVGFPVFIHDGYIERHFPISKRIFEGIRQQHTQSELHLAAVHPDPKGGRLRVDAEIDVVHGHPIDKDIANLASDLDHVVAGYAQIVGDIVRTARTDQLVRQVLHGKRITVGGKQLGRHVFPRIVVLHHQGKRAQDQGKRGAHFVDRLDKEVVVDALGVFQAVFRFGKFVGGFALDRIVFLNLGDDELFQFFLIII